MKISMACIACIGLVVGTASLVVCAGEQVGNRKEGTVLILDNDHVLEGQIDLQVDRYRIRRSVGELYLNASRVKVLCKDWNEAMAFVRSQVNLRDPDERLRLARWCYQHGRPAEALEEVRKANELRPNHPPTMQFLQVVQRAAATNQKIVNKETDNRIVQVSLPSLDLSADSLAAFTTKIQPILMNTCASCHSGQRPDGFHLIRSHGTGASGRRATLQNLAAAVEQIDLERPNLSPLLIKAVSAHGDASHPPINSRKSPPYQYLKQWVESTVASNPHLRDLRAVAQTKRDKADIQPATFAAESASATEKYTPPKSIRPLPKSDPLTVTPPRMLPPLMEKAAPGQSQTPPRTIPAPMENATGETKITGTVPTQPPPPTAQESRPGAIIDEYAPGPFNDLMHPGRKQ